MNLPNVHVLVTYEVWDMCKPSEKRVFTDNAEAQKFYSDKSLLMSYPKWEVKEKRFNCVGDECECAEFTYTIERWTDEIGNEMFRAHAILPNSYSDSRASNVISALANKYYSSIGQGGRNGNHWITGGAHVNVKPGYTEWNNTYPM